MKTTQYSYPVFAIVALYILYFIASTTILSFLPYPSLFVGITLAIVAALMYQITITVTSEKVSFNMGIGLIRGSYDLRKIESCEPVTYSSLGWGIRLKENGLLFNVSGNKAILLKFFTKRYNIWIGTSHPEVVAKYINEKLNDIRK